MLLIASANPEDYTNRGRIITPLKDRFGAEIRTHYPLRLEDELDLVLQEARHATVPDHLLEVIARFTRHVRESPAVDSRSVSARFAIAGAESVAASALRRAALTGDEPAVARVADLPGIVATLQGKVEFEVSEEGREGEVLTHLLRRATAETFRRRLGASDLTALIDKFDEGTTVESGELVASRELLRRVGPLVASASCSNGSTWRTARRRRHSPPPSSSRSRGCTSTAASARTRCPDASSTAAADMSYTAPTATATTRSRRRTTSAAPSTRWARCSAVTALATHSATCSDAAPTGCVGSTTCSAACASSAASYATADASTAPSRRYADCSTALGQRTRGTVSRPIRRRPTA